MERFAGRKERGEMMQLYYILKMGNKKEKKNVILMLFRASRLILTSPPTLRVLQLFSC